MFPDYAEQIINDPDMRTIFDVLKKAHNDGYSSVRIVGGSDRVKEFDKLANNCVQYLYHLDSLILMIFLLNFLSSKLLWDYFFKITIIVMLKN